MNSPGLYLGTTSKALEFSINYAVIGVFYGIELDGTSKTGYVRTKSRE